MAEAEHILINLEGETTTFGDIDSYGNLVKRDKKNKKYSNGKFDKDGKIRSVTPAAGVPVWGVVGPDERPGVMIKGCVARWFPTLDTLIDALTRWHGW